MVLIIYRHYTNESMHKVTVKKLLFILLLILILSIISGLIITTKVLNKTISPEERFRYVLEKPDGYENYDSFDIRELETQIKGYWNYQQENDVEMEAKIKKINSISGEWISEGEYTAGTDIPEGLYLCKNLSAEKDLSSPNLTIIRSGKKDISDQDYYIFKFMNYAFLNKGDVIKINDQTEIIPDNDNAFEQDVKKNFYGEGAYKLGEEIPKGEYFILSMDIQTGGAGVYDDQDKQLISVSRFGYITLDNERAVNLDDCILIALDKKPDINPINYEGKGEGEGKLVYPPGMYKIGVDIPTGKYQMKNEVFKNITDLSFTGYHGNESYNPGDWNWCGIVSGNEKQAKLLGWKQLELDSYLKHKERFVKISDYNNKYSYQKFNGLPTISFSEQNKGSEINIIRCILLPE